jgi:hypothetical protein
MAPDLDPAIAAHYRHNPERDRLETWARLEGVRTRELLGRFLPAPPAVVLDVGGARGAYALPLAREGYVVHLVDPYEPHVVAALAASAVHLTRRWRRLSWVTSASCRLPMRAQMRCCCSGRSITCR